MPIVIFLDSLRRTTFAVQRNIHNSIRVSTSDYVNFRETTVYGNDPRAIKNDSRAIKNDPRAIKSDPRAIFVTVT